MKLMFSPVRDSKMFYNRFQHKPSGCDVTPLLSEPCKVIDIKMGVHGTWVWWEVYDWSC